MKRNTKIGDVFVVHLEDGTKMYLQYIISDTTQLNSDVVRVFSKKYSSDSEPELSEIVAGKTAFHAHCVTKFGIMLGLWERIGNIQPVGTFEHILFRDSEDYGKPEIKKSERWWVWKINENEVYVGKLEGAHQSAEIGIVVKPADIVERIKTGQYSFVYPDF